SPGRELAHGLASDMHLGRQSAVRSINVARGLAFVVLVVFAAMALFPILYMGTSSFKTTGEFIRDPLALPSDWSYFDNYRALWIRFDIPRLFINTFTYIVLSLLLSLAVSVPASFAIAKLNFPLRSVIRLLLIGTLIIPVITYI